MQTKPVVDLHSDLLSYLAVSKQRTPHDVAARSAISQLQAGGVKLQTLAIGFMTTPQSIEMTQVQMNCLQGLLTDYSAIFAPATQEMQLSQDSPVYLLPAFENASSFALEDEPLDRVWTRLQQIIDHLGAIFYISLTWNGENRFGGGVGAFCGLKPDGEELLRWLSGKRIAIDISHASDQLVLDVFHFIDRHGLDLPLVASHSNYRSVYAAARNLPEEFVRELVRRKGLIGLNLFAPFVHEKEIQGIAHHIAYAIECGAEESICFGADFFCTDDFPDLVKKYPNHPPFFFDCQNASGFPVVLNLLKAELSLSDNTLHNIAQGNAMRFLKSRIL